MSKINPIKFTAREEVHLQGTNQSGKANKALFNFGEESITEGDSIMGLESKTKRNITYNTDGTTTTSYDYDADGKIDREVVRDKNGEQKDVIEYSYGFRTFENGEQVPITKTKHEYWNNGKKTGSMRSTIINGKEADREEFSYTENGTSKSYTKYENGKLVSRSETSFYSDGEIIKDVIDVEKEIRIYDENNQLDIIIEFTYPKNENGDVIANVEKETNVKTGEVTIRRYDENNPQVLKGSVNMGF